MRNAHATFRLLDIFPPGCRSGIFGVSKVRLRDQRPGTTLNTCPLTFFSKITVYDELIDVGRTDRRASLYGCKMHRVRWIARDEPETRVPAEIVWLCVAHVRASLVRFVSSSR